MKKVFSVICVTLLFATAIFHFVSCTKIENEDPLEITELRFDITVNNASVPETKAVKTAWEDGDKIYLFFSKKNTQHKAMSKYATLTYNSGVWSPEKSDDLNAYSDLYSYGKMHAVYFPFGNVRNTGSKFLGSSENVAFNNAPVLSFYLIGDADYTIGMTGGIATLSGTLDLSLPDNFVYFFIEENEGRYNQDEKYRLSVEGIKPVTITSWSTSGSFTQEVLGSGQPMWGYKYNDGIAFAGIVDDSWATPKDHIFVFFSDGDPAVTKTFNNALDVTDHKHPSVRLSAPIAANGWTRAIPAPDYTLMGDGLKWARWNLGCTGLSDASTGFSYRWGEIAPANGNYFCLLPLHQSIVDSYVIFDPARALLGADWRMPSKLEFETLASCCVMNASSNGSVTGGDFSGWGVILTSNTGENSNSIVFPTIMGSSLGYWTTTYYNSTGSRAYYKRASSGGGFDTYEDAASSSHKIRPIYIGPDE